MLWNIANISEQQMFTVHTLLRSLYIQYMDNSYVIKSQNRKSMIFVTKVKLFYPHNVYHYTSDDIIYINHHQP